MPLSNGEHLQFSRTLNAVLLGRSQFGVNLARPRDLYTQNLALARDGRTSGITYRGPSLFVELTITSLGLRCTLGRGQRGDRATIKHPTSARCPVEWANFGAWWQPSSAPPARSPTGFCKDPVQSAPVPRSCERLLDCPNGQALSEAQDRNRER